MEQARQNLFENESEENITAMIENGLDERTRTRLGTQESFFAACLRFGTPKLVRKFISKGHNPKELETDGAFPADILADSLKNDMRENNTAMTDILLESGISPGENCVTPLALNGMKLSHLWELIESGTDNGGKWARFRDIMMLLSFCWGNENDIEDSINHGGNVNYSTRLGYTPLMYAVLFNDSEYVKFLITNGADINARNIHNQNAAVLAVTSDYNAWDSDVIRILAEFGADIHDGVKVIDSCQKI